MAEAGGDSKSGGSGVYLLGLLALAAGIFGIVYITRKDEPKPAAAAPTQTASEQPKILNAPPPPPPPKVEDIVTAEPSASASAAPSGHGGPVASGGGSGVCSRCGQGKGSPALSSAIASLQRSAQGCYNRALRTSAASGSMTVAVTVGSNGQVCNASIVNDSVGSGEISNCVLARFQGASLPPPEEGCVVVNAPINFKLAN